ncbi:MAG TPA: response regulator [Nitrospira sp.]|nr:response regulator [Nitrospira sp.]
MDSHPPPIRVLLIDPNKEDREYWTERLTISSPTFSVLEAETGAAGLAICQSQRIDCVVLELTLPDMSGFQVLTRLIPSAYRQELPVILFSRRALPVTRRIAMTNGAWAYLLKDTLPGHELGMAVERAIAAVAFQKRHRWQASVPKRHERP